MQKVFGTWHVIADIEASMHTCTPTALHINEIRSKPVLSPPVYSCVCDSIRLGTGLAPLISVADLGWLLQPITALARLFPFGVTQPYRCVGIVAVIIHGSCCLVIERLHAGFVLRGVLI